MISLSFLCFICSCWINSSCHQHLIRNIGEWMSGQFVFWMQERNEFFQTIPEVLKPGDFSLSPNNWSLCLCLSCVSLLPEVLEPGKLFHYFHLRFFSYLSWLDVLGARELAPFANVLRSIVPIPEAWWQNQMFAVNFELKRFTYNISFLHMIGNRMYSLSGCVHTLWRMGCKLLCILEVLFWSQSLLGTLKWKYLNN